MKFYFVSFSASLVLAGSQPNPPVWPSTVSVFSPSDAPGDIEAKVNAAFSNNGGQTPDNNGQFSAKRYAFLFKPGSYAVDVPVGFYTQVAGLGTTPSDTIFTGSKGVYCEEGSFSVSPGALDTFWRSAENFQTDATFTWTETQGMLWATSQASPLRRVVVTNNLKLFQYRQGDFAAGYASGGFLANSKVAGFVASGSQQQYLTRNSDVSGYKNGVWNMVFVGTKGAPQAHCGAIPAFCANPYVVVDSSPVVAEKPFISFANGKFSLNVPQAKSSTQGPDFDSGTSIDFSDVYVADATKDTATSINAKLSDGLHVVLSPGIYHLDAPLKLVHANQVLLGLGLATLFSTNGNAVVQVGDVDGVRVAGVLLEAGQKATKVLMDWGSPPSANSTSFRGSRGTYQGNATNPGVMSDIFARVCGPVEAAGAQAEIMVRVNSGNVIGDNLWLWRADHTASGLVMNSDCPSNNGMVVNGDDVTMYGLAAEHTLQDLVVWNGNRGSTYFFQSELPYDVTQANYGDKKYAGYLVASGVKAHTSYGAGVYHYFRDHAVTVQTGIRAPVALESSFYSPLAVYLNGKGTMLHVLNDKGNETKQGEPGPGGGPSGAVPEWVCTAPSPTSGLFPALAKAPTCKVGDPVQCPGSSVGCAGNSCCPDGVTCPSADDRFMCCPKPKTTDCTK